MRTYYRGPDVVVNDQVFEVCGPQPLRFLVAKLRDVQVVRTTRRSSWGRATRAFELWAWYERDRVQMYSSPDERVFGQVSRALRRAIEANE